MDNFSEFERPLAPQKDSGSIISHAWENYKGIFIYALLYVVIASVIGFVFSLFLPGGNAETPCPPVESGQCLPDWRVDPAIAGQKADRNGRVARRRLCRVFAGGYPVRKQSGLNALAAIRSNF